MQDGYLKESSGCSSYLQSGAGTGQGLQTEETWRRRAVRTEGRTLEE